MRFRYSKHALAQVGVAFAFLLSFVNETSAALEQADLVLVRYNSKQPLAMDSISLLALADIPGGSVIFITDRGWYNGDFTQNVAVAAPGRGDGTMTWTVPSGGIAAGTYIHIGGDVTVSLSTGGSAGTVSGDWGTTGFSTLGENVTLYQTANNAVGGTPIFIYAFNVLSDANRTSGGWTATASFTTREDIIKSELPGSTGTGIVSLVDVTSDGGSGSAYGRLPHVNDYVYKGPTTAASKAVWVQRVHTTANWASDNDNTYGTTAQSLGSTPTVGNADVTAPTFDVAPAAGSITSSGFSLSASIDEGGTIFYVVVSDGSSAPSSVQVVAGQNATGSSALKSGSQAVSSDPFTYSFSITGLNSSTAYDVYVVARDDESTPNLMSSPVKVDVTTSAPPNSAPTDIALSATSVTLSAASAGATIASLSTVDSDSSDTHTYSLVTGTGSDDNGLFSITGSTLKVGSSALTARSYSIRIRTTDSGAGNLAYEEAFTITVTDNVAPTVVSIVRKNPAAQTTSSTTEVFTVTFSEAVQNVTTGSFAVTPVNGSSVVGSVTSVSPSSGSSATYDVTVNITGGAGEFRLDVPSQ